MKFEFSDEATFQEYFGPAHKMVRRSVKEFVDKEIVPHIEDWEEKNEFPRDLYKKAGDKVTYDAVQIFGGYGFMRGYPVERLYRDNRVLSIGGGTTEIMKEIIAKYIL